MLRLVAVGVNQRGGSSRRKPDVRPPFGRVTAFDWWAYHAGGNELVETRRRALRRGARLDKLGDYAAMRRDSDALAGLDPANVAAQVVLELSYACGGHRTCLNGRSLH